MSQPKRYRLPAAYDEEFMIPSDGGEYVLHSDYAALAAELERLKEAWVDKKMEQDRDALLAENERLRKAGDEMMEVLESEIPFTAMNAVNGWLAAKEGRDAK